MFWTGRASPWRWRIKSVLAAFAMQAGDRERDVLDALSAFGGADSDD